MKIKQLLFFKRTAELEHMTKAAEDLSVSEPYLSKTIAALEKEIDAKLFDRVGRGIKLNPSGRVFYERLMSIFNLYGDTVKEIRNISYSQKNRLTLVTNAGLYMPGLLKLIMVSNPDIKIRMLSAPMRSIITMLQNGEVDFAICSPPIKENVELISEILRYEPGVIIFPEGHRLKNRSGIMLEEVKDETFITAAPGYGTREAFDAYFQKLDVSPPVVIETVDTASVLRYVEYGLGIAAVSESAVLQDPVFRNSYSIVGDGTSGGEVALTWRKKQYMNETGEHFIEQTRKYFAGLEAFVAENKTEKHNNISW